MSEVFLEAIKKIHVKNRFFWAIVLADIIIFGLLVALFDYIGFPGESFVKNHKVINDFSLILIIATLVIIMILKRNFLVPDKLIKKARVKELSGTINELADFRKEYGSKADHLLQVLRILRRYYFLIWSLINFVVLIGFLVFLLSSEIRPFLIYGIVALYALIINYPFFSIVERCYYRIMDED